MDGEELIRESFAVAEGLLRPLGRRWRHVRAVAETAQQLAAVLPPADRPVVVAAAWLHDIGYAPETALTGFHPLDGARFAEQRGFPLVVVQLVACHSGAEFEADERGLLNQLARFELPPEVLLSVLTAADLTTGPDGEAVDVRHRIGEILDRYEPEHPVYRAVTRSAGLLIETTERVVAGSSAP